MRTRDELRKQVESHLHVCLHPEQLRSLTSNITSETSTVRNDESRSISIAVAVTNDSLTSELVGYSNGYDYDHDYDLERILSGECCESLRTITAPQDNPSSDGSIFNEDCRCDSFSGMHLSDLLQDDDVSSNDAIERLCNNDSAAMDTTSLEDILLGVNELGETPRYTDASLQHYRTTDRKSVV